MDVIAPRSGTDPESRYPGADPEPLLAQVESEWARLDALADIETHCFTPLLVVCRQLNKSFHSFGMTWHSDDFPSFSWCAGGFNRP